MPIKGSGFPVVYTAWNTTTNLPVTGDAANHSIRVVGDGTEFTPAASPTEIDATYQPGQYQIVLAASETNYNLISVGGVSSTSHVYLFGTQLSTTAVGVSGTGGSIATAQPYDLVALAEVQTALPKLTSAQLDDVPSVISGVSAAFEGFCRRPLAMRSFSKAYRPGRTRKIYLDTYPVVQCRLRTELVIPLTAMNLDTNTNQEASVTLTSTTAKFQRMASGVAITDATLTLASYPTVASLAAAINALGNGWVAQVGTGYGKTAVSSLYLETGQIGALAQQFEFRWYQREINRWAMSDRGIIELTENRAQAFRYADRAFSLGYGWSWAAASEPRHANVWATYRAGYATQTADLTAGYAPVPQDIKRAAFMAIAEALNLTPAPGVKSENAGAYSYQLGDTPDNLPLPVRRALGPYVNKRI